MYHKPSNQLTTTEKPSGGTNNKDKLILEAAFAPADIRYPTDISLLNEARESLKFNGIGIIKNIYNGEDKNLCTL